MSDPVPSRTVLVLGGARSGKSRFAEALVLKSGRTPVYLATSGTPRDGEMAERVAHHRAQRGDEWRTVEAPLDLIPVLADAARPDTAVLVDCLTLWLANLMEAGRDADAEAAALAASLAALSGPVVFVSNEVGHGVVPENALARRFRDHHGRLNQTIAAAADKAILMVAGRPLVLPKSPDPEIVL
ncbi:bifunctional adenosylcobinamide kinase/adenosylcobinamide-phosphate guanylyltransferase [Amorphus coralli]|uniref:bifunctional adenosylcobinamide kinase/adenosylcobinamide-phosphate guanylyltransferase n=1 Tax=Amorphus coralli TaxID=340680 RepID=UPI000475A6A2|nr:bifunctional adenosylcobinamide kinase/adenosylcobinamide-phosphate guanylyltransferase [Amorphus coralli]